MGDNRTLVSLFFQRVAASPQRAALHFRRGDNPESFSWDQLEDLVRRVAGNLVRAGVRPGDRVAQISENRWEWIVCDLAVLAAGAVHVPIHATLTGKQIAEQLLDSQTVLAILSTPEQVEKLTGVEERLPAELQLFAIEAPHAVRLHRPLRGWEELSSEPGRRETLPAVQDPDAPATILYTSGTTGEPKGVVLTHRNLASNAISTESMNREREEDLRLTVLPLSHVYARTCDVYTWLAGRSELALARSRETVLEDLATWRPTSLNAVPLFYERMMRLLEQRGEAEQPGALRRLLGGRIRMCCCGGAALPDAVYDYYLSQDLPLLQGYGLTETSPVVSLSTLTQYRRGSIGRALPGVEVRLADDGEILTRGPHVMRGYHHRESETEAMLRDGWFHTGDLGRQDQDGYLYITGRKRELIVTSGGKNVIPSYLERLLETDPLIAQAFVIGDARAFLAALIVPEFAQLRQVVEEVDGVSGEGPETLLANPEIVRRFESKIAERLADAAGHEQIRRFRLLPGPFSVEAGEVTSKGSLRREVIEKHYAEEIASMYGFA